MIPRAIGGGKDNPKGITCDTPRALTVEALLACPQADGLVVPDDGGLQRLNHLYLLVGDVGACGAGAPSATQDVPKVSLKCAPCSPGPSKSHSSPATNLFPSSSSKSSKARRRRAVSASTTCSGVTPCGHKGQG